MRVTTISLQMALPALGGHWLDNRWGTGPWMVIFGAVLGFVLAMLELMRLVRNSDRNRSDKTR